MATTIDIAQIQTLTIKQLKAQIAEVTGQTVKSNNRPYLIGKLAKALEAKAAAEAEQARTAKKAKTARKAATTKSEKASKKAEKSTKADKAEKAERRTRTSQQKAGERDPRLPAVGTVLEREHQGKKIRVTVPSRTSTTAWASASTRSSTRPWRRTKTSWTSSAASARARASTRTPSSPCSARTIRQSIISA